MRDTAIFSFSNCQDGIIEQNDIFVKAHNVPVNSQNQADPYCSDNTFLLIASSPLTSAIYTVLKKFPLAEHNHFFIFL